MKNGCFFRLKTAQFGRPKLPTPIYGQDTTIYFSHTADNTGVIAGMGKMVYYMMTKKG
jgi:hypothetical protein